MFNIPEVSDETIHSLAQEVSGLIKDVFDENQEYKVKFEGFGSVEFSVFFQKLTITHRPNKEEVKIYIISPDSISVSGLHENYILKILMERARENLVEMQKQKRLEREQRSQDEQDWKEELKRLDKAQAGLSPSPKDSEGVGAGQKAGRSPSPEGWEPIDLSGSQIWAGNNK